MIFSVADHRVSLSVTQDANTVCQIKKGHAERTWQNAGQETEQLSPSSLYLFLLYLCAVKVRPATVEAKIEYSFESWCPVGASFYLIFWLMNGFVFSVPIFLSIWLHRVCICNICLCPWPLYFYLFIRTIRFNFKKLLQTFVKSAKEIFINNSSQMP